MNYWTNEYMPRIDSMCIEAARRYVTEHGRAIGHAWVNSDSKFGTDEQAFRFLVNCLDEARDDISDYTVYAKEMFAELGEAITMLEEGDWCEYDDCEWAVTL